ncbi:hypothetical protein [Burkholderia vietnamiensis]|uniref:hypothetical protein n=1 Tax=Burkholderia vietnamiensis TaxID=60552 RepID=UPI001B95350C|nr:hypothetical protein [Burkholderia vietnamiensis]MBR8005571.1 hypothetical protein [Burkholderia vietnamiensis]
MKNVNRIFVQILENVNEILEGSHSTTWPDRTAMQNAPSVTGCGSLLATPPVHSRSLADKS